MRKKLNTLTSLPNKIDACHNVIKHQQQVIAEQQQAIAQQQQALADQQKALDQLQTLFAQQQALIAQQNSTNDDLSAELAKVQSQIEELKRYIYGRRSERHVSDQQLPLFDIHGEGKEASDDSQADGQATDLPTAIDEHFEEILIRRRKRQGAVRFPDHLPRVVRTIDVPEAERKCGCCGEEMAIIDVDVRNKLEYVPAKLIVHELHYPKRACSKCREAVVVAAPPPPSDAAATLVEGGIYGFGVATQIICGKFADHLPLYRLEDVFARAGVSIPRSSQVDLITEAADRLAVLPKRMKQRIFEDKLMGLDETPVRLQDASLPGSMKTARMWLARGSPGAPYDVFHFCDDRSHSNIQGFLNGFRGHVIVDAYGVNDGVYIGNQAIVAACCHAHVRRKFEASKSNDHRRATQALTYYRLLFDIEDEAAEMSSEDRLELRAVKSRPLMAKMKAWLDEQAASRDMLPKSKIAGAIRYALNQWRELSVFLEDGRIPIHNNDTERELRRLTIGRNNWLFLGSEAGGQASAILYSVVASAARHHLDVFAYVQDCLRRLSMDVKDVEGLLPDRWAAEHPESIRTYRQQESLSRAAKTKARRALARRRR